MLKETTSALLIYDSGREICRSTPEGRVEYNRRKRIAWESQGKCCALCGKRLRLSYATIDHILPRGMGGGMRNDAQGAIQCVCHSCNIEKGSQRL
jgi:5-methylcytosine-specific restriction endonuclease McrA